MAFNSRISAAAKALMVAGWLSVGFGSAQAQGFGQASAPGQVLVTGATVSDVSATESRVVLTFNQAAPPFSIIANNSETATIAFAGTSVIPAVAPPAGRHGPVQGMTFTQNDSILTFSMTGAGPLRVTALPMGARGLTLSIVGAKGALSKDDRPASPLVAHADTTGPGDVFEVVPLKYADVSEVVGLLTAGQGIKPNDNFSPQEPAFGSAGMSNAYSGGGGGIPTPSFGGSAAQNAAATDSVGQSIDDMVGVDRRLNAIILHGASEKVERLKAQIAKLDVSVNSVVLETVFVELTEKGARNIGLDFNNANSQIATVSYNLSRGGFASLPDTANAGAVNVNLQAAVYAQIQNGQGRIISKPRIAAQSGTTAKIVTGDALPILTSIALSGVNAVSTQVQYVNVGVTLQIAPRVSDDGVVTSHIFAEVSSVTGMSQGYPTISQREATTSATVKDGESFIIGGLSQESDLSTHNKIPLLGDLPALGALFKSENGSKAKTDLYIIVTPHVVRGRDTEAAALAGGY